MKEGQGLIRFVAVSMLLISLYYLSFTVVGIFYDNAENSYIQKQQQNLKGKVSLDSLQKINSYNKQSFRDSLSDKPFLDLFLFNYNYKNISKYRIKQGLDLKGGMSFVLAVNQQEILKSLSNYNKDANFNKALDMATANQANSQESYLNLFLKSYKEIAPNNKLALIFANQSKYQGKINLNDDNQKVINTITSDVNSALGNTFNVIKSRIDQLGVAEAVITLQEGTGRIIVEIPGSDDVVRIKKLIESSAKLEFWYTYDAKEIVKDFEAANETLKGLVALEKSSSVVKDSSSNIQDTTKENTSNKFDKLKSNTKDTSKLTNSNPLFEVFQYNVNPQNGNVVEGPMIGYTTTKNLDKVMNYLNREELKRIFKSDVRFVWSAKPIDEKGKVYALYALKGQGDRAPLSGDVVENSSQESDQMGKPGVSMSMNAQGASQWEKMTDIAANDPIGPKSIAIVLDNVVYSAPRVQNKISGGRSSISGDFTIEEATDLANILNSGKIDAPAKIIQEEVVGPTLGKDTIKSGILSLAIGLLSILGYMFLLYRKPGLIANLALIINLIFLLGVLTSIEAVLTLPGIAGIVLIIGAAVDANVIIFERVKEELRKGKSLLNSLIEGYKHSYVTIFDANATTLITSLTLMFFGYGPIKGFAITLTIGIFTSIFTAVFLTREFFNYNIDKKREIPFIQSFFDKYFNNSNYQFISKRKIAYAFSSFFILIGLISIFTIGFDLGVDFKGGRSYVINFDNKVDATKIKELIGKNLDNKTIVKNYGNNNQIQITTSYLYDGKVKNAQKEKENDNIVLQKIYESVKSQYTTDYNFSTFVNSKISNTRKIDATIADDIQRSAKNVTIIALLLIFAYVTIRFYKWQYALGAIAALIHDLFFTLGVLSLLKNVVPFSLEMNQSIIAAVLTIVGFSTNDTVVIFDRIREYVKLNPNKPLDQTINDAINATLSRTIMTASTLFLVTLVLFAFGGESIRGFSFTMLIGILIGTLSSIFVASPVALDLINLFSKKKSN